MDIRSRLDQLAKASKDWQAVWFMPNGDCRTFQAPREGMAESWLERNIKNHGGEGYVELTPSAYIAATE